MPIIRILLLGLIIISLNIRHAVCQSSSSQIHVTVLDEKQKSTPVRVRITDASGHAAGIPEQVISIMYGRDDKPERYSYQPDSSFYVAGYFQLDLDPGTYTISLSKGVEYLDQAHIVELPKGEKKNLEYKINR